MLKHVVDGFTFNTSLQYLPVRFFPNALAQLDILRRAENYRARWFVVPDDLDQPIQPFDTFYYQINVAQGSYLWGYSFSTISATDPNGAPVETTAKDILIQIVDSCTGVPLGVDFWNGGASHSSAAARLTPTLLTQPRLILEPGLCNVELSNRTANTITCQILLHFAEPCRVVDEDTRERQLWALR